MNFDEAAVPAYVLPDPLRFQDGSVVADADAWGSRRREIRSLFEEHVYGRLPSVAAAVTLERIGEDGLTPDGGARRLERRVSLLDDPCGPGMDLLLLLPVHAARPVPIFLGLNFFGNAAVHPDPTIRLSRSWMRTDPRRGLTSYRAGPASRGAEASRWPIEAVLARGFGLATVYCGDIAPDDPARVRDGLLGGWPPDRSDASGAAIAAWALGLSRALDALHQIPDVDPRRVAVLGHSRLGKAALWAGALDERFALVISNESGCGGAALSRRRFGETVAAITTLFPHWFAPRFARYAGAEAALPVDQHQLLSVVAPRPLYVASAADDLWADPKGEWLALCAAEPVYRLLGVGGVPDGPVAFGAVPAASRVALSPGRLGHHCRAGGHDLTLEDWEHFLSFAGEHLRV